MSARRQILTNDSFSKTKDEDNESQYLQPVAPPATISNVFVTLILQFCRKIVFFNIKFRLTFYILSLFLVSMITDALPIPQTYFSNTNNVLNSYFVKFGWFWTLVITVPFVLLTSITYCCGRKDMVIRHVSRLLIATVNWYVFVNLFNYIEERYGSCVGKREIKCKQECTLNGYRWNGLDISGHSFILIYSTLLLIEEARCIIGWESLKDIIRNEAHWRVSKQRPFSPLRELTTSHFIKLHFYYLNTLPYIRALFVLLTVFTVIWDLMLLTTVFYFHSMPEKLFGGLTAIFTWFVTYHIWYKFSNIPPYSPGEGLFKYNISSETKRNDYSSTRRNSVPSFMGMRVNVQTNDIS